MTNDDNNSNSENDREKENKSNKENESNNEKENKSQYENERNRKESNKMTPLTHLNWRSHNTADFRVASQSESSLTLCVHSHNTFRWNT